MRRPSFLPRLLCCAALVVATSAAAGCMIYTGDDDDCNYDWGGVAQGIRNPDTNQCEYWGGGGGGCDDTPVYEPQAYPDWAYCDTACEQLDGFGVEEAIAGALGIGAPTAAAAGDDVCVYESGDVVVEIHRVEESDVTDDWYRRPGIDPVGEVGGDAVGLASFLPPGGSEGVGYTIALTSGRRGVVVAVRAPSDARLVAAAVAVLAAQAI